MEKKPPSYGPSGRFVIVRGAAAPYQATLYASSRFGIRNCILTKAHHELDDHPECDPWKCGQKGGGNPTPYAGPDAEGEWNGVHACIQGVARTSFF